MGRDKSGILRVEDSVDASANHVPHFYPGLIPRSLVKFSQNGTVHLKTPTMLYEAIAKAGKPQGS
ncbi:MAG: hypothetical protein Fur0046_14530 [Cyanobacteria bacterium J069]